MGADKASFNYGSGFRVWGFGLRDQAVQPPKCVATKPLNPKPLNHKLRHSPTLATRLQCEKADPPELLGAIRLCLTDHGT